MKKFLSGAAIAMIPFMGFISQAKAAALFAVPTSTVTTLTANVTDTLADPGLLAVLVVAAALPVIFWVIHRVKGLFPKGR